MLAVLLMYIETVNLSQQQTGFPDDRSIGLQNSLIVLGESGYASAINNQNGILQL